MDGCEGNKLDCDLIAKFNIWIFLVVIFAGVVFLYYWRKWIEGGQFHSDIRIDAKRVIVTGCNNGIGKQTVLDLAKRGAHIYMACRNFNLCETTRQEIIAATGNHNIFNRELDLSSMESIRKFATRYKQEEKRLDILINNAGIFAPPRTLTKDGFEMQLGVNHLGHFLLTNLLLDHLKASAPSRIIVVTSKLYKYGKINRKDLHSEKSYDKIKAYMQSKLANVLFVQGLTVRLKDTKVTINAVNPGAVKTEIGRFMPLVWIIWGLFYFFSKTLKSAAQTTIRVAVDPELENVTGQYFSDCKPSEIVPNTKETAEWLWDESERLTQIKKLI